MKKLVLLLALVGSMNLLMTGCTSSESQSENGEAVSAENTESTDGSGELESLDGDTQKQAENSLDSELPGENKPSELDQQQSPPPEIASQEQPADQKPSDQQPSDQQSTAGVDPGSEQKPSDQQAQSAPPEAIPPADTAAPTENKPIEVAAPKPSLKKIKDMPFKEGEQLLNSVYVARPKDTFSSISKLIYGDATHVKSLKSGNPTVKTVRAGDKIYYNSPQRPTDESMMKVYYEDVGQVPETYTAKEGDDLKKLSKELLGFSGAWKEVWAINPVESKDKLTEGTTLRYWKGAPPASSEVAPSAPTMAGTTGGMPTEMPPPPMPTQAEPMMPPPPPPMNEVSVPPPPPPMPEMAPPPTNMGSTAPPPSVDTPPPPPVAVQPPMDNPPPRPKKAVQAEASGMDDMMMLGAVGVLVVGIAAIVIMRKRKQQKEMAAVFNENTQIGA